MNYNKRSKTFTISYKNTDYIIDKNYVIENYNYENLSLPQIVNNAKFNIIFKDNNILNIKKDNIIIKPINKLYIIDINIFNETIIVGYNNNIFTIDIDIFNFIINNKNKIKCDINNELYIQNYGVKVNFINSILHQFDTDTFHYFIDNNKFNLRKNNIIMKHNYEEKIMEKFPNEQNIKYIPGHFNNNSNSMKNPMWLINDIYYVYCSSKYNTNYFIIDQESKNIIDKFENDNNIKLTFYKNNQGYIVSNPNKLYLHQIIMNCHGQGKGTKKISVDHIDRNRYNNCKSNLRIATQIEQQQNSKGIIPGTKRNRKISAQKLPNGIEQHMMPKYIYYCTEIYNKEKGSFREFFRIEKHPKLKKKLISGSKSMKKSISEKLDEIKEILNKLDNDTYYEDLNNTVKYPIGIRIKNNKFILDLRKNEKRYNMSMKINKTKSLQEQLEIFKSKIIKKYEDYNYFK
jgi:hypothetical protein